MKSKHLHLNLKGEYFHAIRAGKKVEEYRLYNDYWRKRLVRAYDKALKAFDDLRRNKRQRRKWARMLVREWHSEEYFLDAKHMTQDVADMLADENVYYMMW